MSMIQREFNLAAMPVELVLLLNLGWDSWKSCTLVQVA